LKRIKQIENVLLTALLLCLCIWQMPARADASGVLEVYSDLSMISRHGNVRLVTDHVIQQKDLEDAGIEPGDTVKVTFLDKELEMLVGYNFSEAASGEVLLRIRDDSVSLTINMGDFASEYICDKVMVDNDLVTWKYKDGIKGSVAFRIELIRKGEPSEESDLRQMMYSDERSDYPELSDPEFANFRMIKTTGMGDGALYRTATPINPKHNRNTYADAALRNAGIRTVINLADSKETAEGYDGYSESYYATTDFLALNMEMSFFTEDFREKLARGLRFLGSHQGPYAVHCTEGKDRTGIVAALLECFMGANWEEVKSDYMKTFYNYFGITPDEAAYQEIAEDNIATSLRRLFRTDDLKNTDLARTAEEFFRSIGLSGEEIENLRTNLGRSWLTGTVPKTETETEAA
jgi:protein tyrosine/serine phosphatase